MISFFDLMEQKYDQFYQQEKAGILTDESPWYKATIEACLELVHSEFNPNERNYGEGTILCYIVETGKLDLVKFLVESGADVNITSYDEMTFPLGEAARYGYQEIYDYLFPLTNAELARIAKQDFDEGLEFYQKGDNLD